MIYPKFFFSIIRSLKYPNVGGYACYLYSLLTMFFETQRYAPSVLFVIAVLFGYPSSTYSVEMESEEVRAYVKLCRKQGRDEGINDRTELRDYMEECMNEMREAHSQTNPPNKNKNDVAEVIRVDDGNKRFNGSPISK